MQAAGPPREGGRPRSPARGSRHVCTSDLDDLHPQLIYGALLSFLRALRRSLVVVAPAVLSWRVLLSTALVVTALRFFLPLGLLGLGIAMAEGCFGVWLRLVRRRLQRPKPVAERLPAPAGAMDVYRRTVQCWEEAAAWSSLLGPGWSPTTLLEGWFLGAPLAQIRRGNMIEFVAWAFYSKQEAELEQVEWCAVLEMIEDSERRFGWKFGDGYEPTVVPIRINFDRLVVWCHPLLYYLGIWALTAATRQTLRLFGFSYHHGRTGHISFFHAPLRASPGSVIVGGDEVPAAAPPPIVFLHGLGVGLPPYLPFIRRLAAERECFIVELPEVSQVGTEQVLAPSAMAEAIEAMLRAYGHASAHFVAHSYGTFVLSWVLRARRDIVAKAVLLDPVCFLLAQPDVAFNFLYRRPINPFTLAVTHFVRWEIFSANVLMREFYWYHNVLWKEELPAQCVVVLAGGDDIMNARAVRCYLEDYQRQQANGPSHCQLTLLWLEHFFHGEVLLSKRAQLQIMELL